nr:hypothetical protein [Ktedonobacteraceae bacterium]
MSKPVTMKLTFINDDGAEGYLQADISDLEPEEIKSLAEGLTEGMILEQEAMGNMPKSSVSENADMRDEGEVRFNEAAGKWEHV